MAADCTNQWSERIDVHCGSVSDWAGLSKSLTQLCELVEGDDQQSPGIGVAGPPLSFPGTGASIFSPAEISTGIRYGLSVDVGLTLCFLTTVMVSLLGS